MINAPAVSGEFGGSAPKLAMPVGTRWRQKGRKASGATLQLGHPPWRLQGKAIKLSGPSHWSECGQTMGQETTFEVFAKRPAIICMTGVIVPLPFKLLRAGTFESCLEVLGNR